MKIAKILKYKNRKHNQIYTTFPQMINKHFYQLKALPKHQETLTIVRKNLNKAAHSQMKDK